MLQSVNMTALVESIRPSIFESVFRWLPTASPPEVSPGETSRGAASLITLLENAANSQAICTFFPTAKTVTYLQLYHQAQAKAPLIANLVTQCHKSISPVVLLHFDSMEDSITWFWAAIVAGVSPAISTPLPVNPNQRKKHLSHLAKLLEQPLVLTTTSLWHEIKDTENFTISTIEQLVEMHKTAPSAPAQHLGRDISPKILMLTSGSSGNAKAVELEAAQIITAIRGKSKLLESDKNDVFLNWIGFDHVANLTECHLHAMYLCADQIHVPARDIISDPWLFLSITNRWRVTASFAPNFFLSSLLQTVENTTISSSLLDLSCLRRVTSGGEGNVVETATRLTNALRRFGARDDIINPGFGMTEICAGAIQNRQCPAYDVQKEYEFTSLGTPIENLRMRIMRDNGDVAESNEIGTLQISGPVVFKKYHNNPQATADAFTSDGWFVTGDKAFINEDGSLCLSCRDSDVINLNGIKYSPQEIEMALEEAREEFGITPSYTATFSVRPHNAAREEICVLYHPTFALDDVDARIKAAKEITRIVAERTSARPKHIIPLPKEALPKSALGKLSRAKLRAAFEKAEFQQYEDRLNSEIKERKQALHKEPSTDKEKLVFEELSAMLMTESKDQCISVNDSIFDFGITSTDLFLLKNRIDGRLGPTQNIPIGALLTNATIRGIAAAIEQVAHETSEYSHFVPLQREGSKAPLFLVHPGSGDVLIFVHLAKYFPDRPVYGIRTRALYEGDNYFETIDEMAATYVEGVKKIQPNGPYAIAGYSLGSTVAFEMAKLLEAQGDQVPFCGILDSPPHFRHLVCDLGFNDVLINVAYFLELINEEYAVASQVSLTEMSEDNALEVVLANAPKNRLETLGIDKARLRKITEVTWSFGKAAKHYDPVGSIAQMDIFWVHPLLWVAQDRNEWMDKHLRHWVDFSRQSPRYHECEGVHSLMLNTDYVDGVAKKMRSALRARRV